MSFMKDEQVMEIRRQANRIKVNSWLSLSTLRSHKTNSERQISNVSIITTKTCMRRIWSISKTTKYRLEIMKRQSLALNGRIYLWSTKVAWALNNSKQANEFQFRQLKVYQSFSLFLIRLPTNWLVFLKHIDYLFDSSLFPISEVIFVFSPYSGVSGAPIEHSE